MTDNFMLKRMATETVLNDPIKKKEYIIILIYYLSLGVKQIHIPRTKKIQIGDIEIMTDAYSSSEQFGSIVRRKSIGHKTYTEK